jgi:hypothetical protein
MEFDMRKKQCGAENASIAVLGNFNPAIFHPDWFAKKEHNLIRPEEADPEKIKIINPDISIFSTEWFRLEAIRERCIFATEDASKYDALRDLVSGSFELLVHTPVKAFGFNRAMHFSFADEEEWHAFGNFYAPKQVWEKMLHNPGLRSMTINGHKEPEDPYTIQIKIEPSETTRWAVSIHVNQHYPCAESEDSIALLQQALREEWRSFITYCDDVSGQLLKNARHRRKKNDNNLPI